MHQDAEQPVVALVAGVLDMSSRLLVIGTAAVHGLLQTVGSSTVN